MSTSIIRVPRIINPGGAASGAPAPAGPSFSLTFADHKEDTSNGTVVTYAAMSFGAADTNRVVAVGIGARAGSATVTGVTIGGITASQAIGAAQSTALLVSDIWYAAVPT